MFCRNCGKQIDNNASVCEYCGTQVGPVKKQKKFSKLSKIPAAVLAWFTLLVFFVTLANALHLADLGGFWSIVYLLFVLAFPVVITILIFIRNYDKKPFYQKWWVWLIGAFLAIAFISATTEPSASEASTPPADVQTEPSTEASTEAPTEATTETPTEAPTEVPTEAPTEAPTEKYKATTGERNALRKAKQYLRYSAFSYEGLIRQLEYEDYTYDEAVYGADNCGADWNEQALIKAKDYLDYSAFSYSGLINQLEYESFTSEQAVYGADNCGADWNDQAVKCAKEYLYYSAFSREGLIDQLEYEGFTHEQAVYGVEANGY